MDKKVKNLQKFTEGIEEMVAGIQVDDSLTN